MDKPSETHFTAIQTLLADQGLPTDDLHLQDLSMFLIDEVEGKVEAVGGLERFEQMALLRSVATTPSRQGQGVAKRLVSELENLAMSAGIHSLYLLTETAEGFFERLDYRICERGVVPPEIQASRQFSSLCPDTAAVMVKELNPAASLRGES